MKWFLTGLLGFWVGSAVAGIAVALLAHGVAGMPSDSGGYALILFPSFIAGGWVGANLAQRIRCGPPSGHIDGRA